MCVCVYVTSIRKEKVLKTPNSDEEEEEAAVNDEDSDTEGKPQKEAIVTLLEKVLEVQRWVVTKCGGFCDELRSSSTLSITQWS